MIETRKNHRTVIIWIGFLVLIEAQRSWHAINESERVKETRKGPVYVSLIAQALREAWGVHPHRHNISSPYYQELHFDEAIDIVYKHQHPPDCSKVSFLVSQGYVSGFGSEVHVEGLGLSMAMELGRIYMPVRERNPKLRWQTSGSYCGQEQSWNCYFEPWTNCSWADVDRAAAGQPKVRMFKLDAEAKNHLWKTGKVSKKAIDAYKNEKVVSLLHAIHFDEFRHRIPPQLGRLAALVPTHPSRLYYWKRAVLAAYMLRLNERTQKMVRASGIPGAAELQGRCVGMYVRHGDKAREMKLSAVDRYYSTVAELWKRTFPGQPEVSVVLGTETPRVLAEAVTLARDKHWTLFYNRLQLQIFEQKGLKMPGKERPGADFFERFTGLDFPMMLSNLRDLMLCDAFVCTLQSNYCRLLDEMRATVAVKPHALFADLSSETCGSPPCIGPENFVWFGWR